MHWHHSLIVCIVLDCIELIGNPNHGTNVSNAVNKSFQPLTILLENKLHCINFQVYGKRQPLAGSMPKRVRQASPGFTLDREAGLIECINLGCWGSCGACGDCEEYSPICSYTHSYSLSCNLFSIWSQLDTRYYNF